MLLPKALYVLASALLLAGCVSTPVNPPDAKVVVGYRVKNALRTDTAYISAYPFNAATGAAGRMYVPSGQSHFHLKVKKPEANGVVYEVFDVVAGDYVLGHALIPARGNDIKWFCPAYAFSVMPGSTTYIGDLNFDNTDFTGVTFDIDALKYSGAVATAAVTQTVKVNAPINYAMYTNPGLMAGIANSPCASEG